jgi:hypothetical protein
MILNLKTLGAGLVAVIAISALVAPGLMADSSKHTGGHFTNDAPGGDASLEVKETTKPSHTVRFFLFGGKHNVKCTDATYSGGMNDATQTEIELFPGFKDCWLDEAHGKLGEETVTFTMNGCSYKLTIRETEVDKKHSPLHIACPTGKKIEMVAHGLCTITIPPQTQTNGLSYYTRKKTNWHEVTVNVTIPKLKYEKHGLCTFEAPAGTGPHETGIEYSGAFRIKAYKNATEQVNITATGADGSEGEETEEEGEE